MPNRFPNPTSRQWFVPVALLILVAVALLVYFRTFPPVSPDGPARAAAVTPAEEAATPTDRTSWAQRLAAADAAEFRDLLREAFEAKDEALRQRLMTELITAWLNRDPKDFARYFASLQVYAEQNSTLRQVVMLALAEALTKLSPEAAASDHVFAILAQFVANLALTDPEAALRWARQWLLDDMLDASLVTIARELSRTNPQRAIEVAGQAGAELRRMQGYHGVAGIWAETKPEEALAWAAALRGPTERAMVLNSVLLSVSQRDPVLAATKLVEAQRQMAEEYARTRQANLAALNLTEADQANDSERYREMLSSGAIAPSSSPDIELMAASARVIAGRLAETDPAAAIAWTDSLGHDFLRKKSMAGLLDGWARTAPADALAFQRANYPQSNELLTAVFDSWGASNPQVAAQATRNLAEPANRIRALESVVNAWVLKDDPSTVAAWLDALPVGEKSDAMTSTVAAALSVTTPEQSWQRALAITNETERYRALKAAFSVLVVESPTVARGLLANASLSEKHYERLNEMLKAVGADK